jgi:hypothetical protein
MRLGSIARFAYNPAILLIYNGYWAKYWMIPCTVSGAYGQEMTGIIVKIHMRLGSIARFAYNQLEKILLLS